MDDRAGPWIEIADRVFAKRYRFFDQQIGVVLGRRGARDRHPDLRAAGPGDPR